MSQYFELLDYVWSRWSLGDEFTRAEVREGFDPAFAQRHPTRTPSKTIDTKFVLAVRRGVFEHVDRGTYKLLVGPTIEREDPSVEEVSWLVGASYGGQRDQTERFLADGIWEHGYADQHLDTVRSMQVGDRIAIKSSYVRKHGLPFDGRGHSVSAIKIKSRGTILENDGSGRRVIVDWEELDPPREWFFYTYRGPIWRVTRDDWRARALIDFVFEDAPQDYDRFRNSPWWRDRFGDVADEDRRFTWTEYYEQFASALQVHRSNRETLARLVAEVAEASSAAGHLTDRFRDGTSGPLRDICPFTTTAIFNRGLKPTNRRAIAREFGERIGIDVDSPASFDGIPVLNNMNSWFFGYERDRGSRDIDILWDLHAAAIDLADRGEAEDRDTFQEAFDAAQSLPGIGWKLTFGLYWARPWSFPPLDRNSRTFIKEALGEHIGSSGPKGRVSGADYLDLIDRLQVRFDEEASPIRSFPELSYAAWANIDSPDTEAADDDPEDEAAAVHRVSEVFTVDSIVQDGCFVPKVELERMLERLRRKRNLILQGPPGTGKTWLARRLAFALAGQRDDALVTAVQFHPNLSYEDFVRGWRPGSNGKLELVDGVFLQAVTRALRDPEAAHVVVIEEINRGNPAQVFGELLTLLEADKRSARDALALSYRHHDAERVHLPDNLYVIGTMNVADRSLALVDLAFRRRFAFVDLVPRFNEEWAGWVTKVGLSPDFVETVRARLTAVNDEISADPSLGPQFRVGHSFATPDAAALASGPHDWFHGVVESEIGPLLDEYWFDDAAKAAEARGRLVADLA